MIGITLIEKEDYYQPGYQNQSNSLFEPGAFGRYYMYQDTETLCNRLQTQSELRYLTFDDHIRVSIRHPKHASSPLQIPP